MFKKNVIKLIPSDSMCRKFTERSQNYLKKRLNSHFSSIKYCNVVPVENRMNHYEFSRTEPAVVSIYMIKPRRIQVFTSVP